MIKNITKNTLFFCTLIAVLSSCERNTLTLPNEGGTDPVFRLDMNVDDQPLVVIAGVDGVYNQTDFDLDQEEVYTFSGVMAEEGCDANCPNSYSVKLRNYESGSENIELNESFSKKSYAYKNENAPTQDAVELQLSINTQAVSPDFSWVIGGDRFSQQELNSNQIINIDPSSEVFATLTVFDEETGLSSFNNKEIQLDGNMDGISSYMEIKHILGDSVELSIVHSDSEDFTPLPFTLWAMEDLDGKNPQLVPNQTGKIAFRIGEGKSIENVTSFLGAIDGTKTSVGVQMKYDSDLDEVIYHDASYDYLIAKRIVDGSDLALQSFEFEMIDEDGILFSSAKGEQSEDARFQILEIEPYLENENGQKTVKMTCAFTCQVFATDGSVKQINDAQAVIAVAIP